MLSQTRSIITTAEQYAINNCGRSVTHIPTWRIRKEELAHEKQRKNQISSGLIGVWSCLEQGSSYRAVYCSENGFPQLKNYQTQCKHLYFYFDDIEYGFMNIRLQTWFPYHIQVCLNGREWLRWSTTIIFSPQRQLKFPSLIPYNLLILYSFFHYCLAIFFNIDNIPYASPEDRATAGKHPERRDWWRRHGGQYALYCMLSFPPCFCP